MGGRAGILVVTGFGIILGMIGMRMNELESQAINNMAYYSDVTQSHNLAVAGANAGMSILYSDTSKNDTVLFSRDYSDSRGPFAGGKVQAEVRRVVIGGVTRYRLRSLASFPNPDAMPPWYYDTVEVFLDVKMFNSFSMYAWMTNVEGNVNWITGDTVWGKVHSNDSLKVTGKPVYMEKVTTAKAFRPPPGVFPDSAVFKAGYETGVAPIKLPSSLAQITDNAPPINLNGRKYTATTVYITLAPGSPADGDGKVYIRTTSFVSAIVDSISITPPFNGVIVCSNDARVRPLDVVTNPRPPCVDGALTICALRDLYIDDDLTYERDPRLGPSDDMLGLVAERHVYVTDNAANNSDITIHASIFARTGSFTAQNYGSRPVSGLLKTLGAIVQNTRGAVGTFSGTNPPVINHGFLKRYRYDTRLADPTIRPPYFPGFYTPTLHVASWWENVRMPKY